MIIRQWFCKLCTNWRIYIFVCLYKSPSAIFNSNVRRVWYMSKDLIYHIFAIIDLHFTCQTFLLVSRRSTGLVFLLREKRINFIYRKIRLCSPAKSLNCFGIISGIWNRQLIWNMKYFVFFLNILKSGSSAHEYTYGKAATACATQLCNTTVIR